MGSGGQLHEPVHATFSDTFLPRSTKVSQFVMRQLPTLIGSYSIDVSVPMTLSEL